MLRSSSLIAFICLTAGWFGCTGQALQSANEGRLLTYPQWFWTPPIDFACAVGYARTYFYRRSSIEQATENAIDQLARQHQVDQVAMVLQVQRDIAASPGLVAVGHDKDGAEDRIEDLEQAGVARCLPDTAATVETHRRF